MGQGFLGRLPEGEHFRLMAGARATVLPSVWPEPLPAAAVESISLGVPVMGSGLGGIPEVVDGYGVSVAREDGRGCGEGLRFTLR